jgi:hypothetical protein
MLNPYKRTILVECGACMYDNNGNLIGNSCFFNSLKAGLMQYDTTYSTLNYSSFLSLGGFENSFKGKMVDTFDHSVQINQIAFNLGVKISVYTEIIPGITNSTIYAPFGIQGPEIRIIRLRGFAHFNLMLWHADQVLIKADKALAEEIDRKMQEEEKKRKTQLLEDAKLAKSIQEDYVRISKLREEEESRRRQKQIDEDRALAEQLSRA